MKRLILPLRARPRLTSSIAIGIAVALLLPGTYSPATRGLLGWNVAVWLYLLLVGVMISRADHERLRRTALAQAEGAGTVLAAVVLAALASLVGIVVELAAAKVPGAPHALPHALFALTTVAGAWLLLPTLFALTYASLYYRAPQGSGLRFTDEAPEGRPDYGDFLYFSFTIAAASQTSDVSVSTRAMRRLVLVQSMLSFAFNTAILAFTINIAASLF
jgi:uncharacterized membrane protein